jgi:hypothetical protein
MAGVGRSVLHFLPAADAFWRAVAALLLRADLAEHLDQLSVVELAVEGRIDRIGARLVIFGR